MSRKFHTYTHHRHLFIALGRVTLEKEIYLLKRRYIISKSISDPRNRIPNLLTIPKMERGAQYSQIGGGPHAVTHAAASCQVILGEASRERV